MSLQPQRRTRRNSASPLLSARHRLSSREQAGSSPAPFAQPGTAIRRQCGRDLPDGGDRFQRHDDHGGDAVWILAEPCRSRLCHRADDDGADLRPVASECHRISAGSRPRASQTYQGIKTYAANQLPCKARQVPTYTWTVIASCVVLPPAHLRRRYCGRWPVLPSRRRRTWR